MKRTVMLLLFLALGIGQGSAQTSADVVAKFGRSCVSVRCEGNRGGGFVVGSLLDTAIIVTAYHVVEQVRAGEEVRVEYRDGSSAPFRIHHSDSTMDLAVLHSSKPGYHAPTFAFHADQAYEQPIWIICTRKGWSPIPVQGAGEFFRYARDGSSAIALLPGALHGDSGSMVFTYGGIAGMITEMGDEISVLPAPRIIAALSQLYPELYRVH